MGHGPWVIVVCVCKILSAKYNQQSSQQLKKKRNKQTLGLGGIAPPSPSLLLLVASVAVRDGPWAMGDSRLCLQNTVCKIQSAVVPTTKKKRNKQTFGLGGIAPPSPSLLLLVASVAVRDGPWAMGDSRLCLQNTVCKIQSAVVPTTKKKEK